MRVCVCVHACQRLTLEGHAALDHVIQRDTGRPDIHLCGRKRAHALWTTDLFKGRSLIVSRPDLFSRAIQTLALVTPPTGIPLRHKDGRKEGGNEGRWVRWAEEKEEVRRQGEKGGKEARDENKQESL